MVVLRGARIKNEERGRLCERRKGNKLFFMHSKNKGMEQIVQIAQSNTLTFAITIFMLVFGAFIYASPSFAFDDKGRAKPFGIGMRRRTVTPVWLIAIIIAILSYTAALYVGNINV